VDQALKTIEEQDEYKAIIATTSARARDRAKEIDRRIANHEQVGKLAGVPFIAKDNFLAFGADTTAASNILKGFDAPYQATAIERLELKGLFVSPRQTLMPLRMAPVLRTATSLRPKILMTNPGSGGSSGGSGSCRRA